MDDLKQKKSLEHVASYKLSKVSISSSCSFSEYSYAWLGCLCLAWQAEWDTGLRSSQQRLPAPIRSQLEIIVIFCPVSSFWHPHVLIGMNNDFFIKIRTKLLNQRLFVDRKTSKAPILNSQSIVIVMWSHILLTPTIIRTKNNKETHYKLFLTTFSRISIINDK